MPGNTRGDTAVKRPSFERWLTSHLTASAYHTDALAQALPVSDGGVGQKRRFFSPNTTGRKGRAAVHRTPTAVSQPLTAVTGRCVQTAIGQPPTPTEPMLKSKKMDVPTYQRWSVQYSPGSVAVVSHS